MKAQLSLIVLICLTTINLIQSKQVLVDKEVKADAVQVGVYYESHNDASMSYITSQLKLSQNLLNIANIDLVPWGRTEYNAADNTFKCNNNGDIECQADRIHACAITLHPNNQTTLLTFITCTNTHSVWKTQPWNSTVDCLHEVDLVDPDWADSFTQIEQCSELNDIQDVNIFLAMRNKTLSLNPTLSTVPVVTVNGEQNANAITDLKTEICNKYTGVKPTDCPTTPTNQVKVGLFYESFDDNSINFITTQLQLPQSISDIAAIDLVPWGTSKYDQATNTFTCKNGPQECHADRLHACAMTYHSDNQTALLQFTTCTVKDSNWKTNPAESANICANNIDSWVDPFPELETCANMNDTEVINIFLGMRDKTIALNPPLTSVPVITINSAQSSNARDNLITEICNIYTGTKPSECSGAAQILHNKLFNVIIALISIIYFMK